MIHTTTNTHSDTPKDADREHNEHSGREHCSYSSGHRYDGSGFMGAVAWKHHGPKAVALITCDTAPLTASSGVVYWYGSAAVKRWEIPYRIPRKESTRPLELPRTEPIGASTTTSDAVTWAMTSSKSANETLHNDGRFRHCIMDCLERMNRTVACGVGVGVG